MMKRIKGNTYFVEASTNVGIFVHDETVVMIDSFSNEKDAKKFLVELEESGLKVDHIINTHFHADHIQGNRIFQNKMGSKIWVKNVERGFIEHPELEGYYLFSAEPIKELRISHFKAKSSRTFDVEGFNLKGLKIIDLSGHSPGQIGILTEDNVLFCGDTYFGKEIMKKYVYPYHTNIEKALKSLDTLVKMRDIDFFVPSHGRISCDPVSEINMNKKAIEQFVQSCLSILKEPMTKEKLMEKLVEKFKLNLNVGTYFLFHSFISAVLKYLYDKDLIMNGIHGGRMVWFESSKGAI